MEDSAPVFALCVFMHRDIPTLLLWCFSLAVRKEQYMEPITHLNTMSIRSTPDELSILRQYKCLVAALVWSEFDMIRILELLARAKRPINDFSSAGRGR